MLIAEQYLVIYLFSLFLIKQKDLKILSLYFCTSILLDSIIHSYFYLSPIEYVVISYMVELILFIISILFINDVKLKIMISLFVIIGMIPTMTILSIPYLLTRDDYFSYVAYFTSKWIAQVSNEVFIYIILHLGREFTASFYYLTTFILINYLVVILK